MKAFVKAFSEKLRTRLFRDFPSRKIKAKLIKFMIKIYNLSIKMKQISLVMTC